MIPKVSRRAREARLLALKLAYGKTESKGESPFEDDGTGLKREHRICLPYSAVPVKPCSDKRRKQLRGKWYRQIRIVRTAKLIVTPRKEEQEND